MYICNDGEARYGEEAKSDAQIGAELWTSDQSREAGATADVRKTPKR